MYVKHEVEIFIDSMIQHNGRLSDPLNRYSKMIKAISSKRKKTDADHEALARIEYEGSLYLNSANEVIIPGRVFEAFLAEAARKSKEGKQALAGMFVDNDAVISYDGGPLTPAQLIESDAHRLAVPVRVGTSRVIRTRPIFKNVKATFVVSIETTVANSASLQRWITDGLQLVGLSEWRPRHGRGILTNFEVLAAPLSVAA